MLADRRRIFRGYNRLGGPHKRDPRLNRALGVALAGEARKLPNGSYLLTSGSGNVYHVWPRRACSCPDAALRGRYCKHLLALDMVS